MKPSRVEQVLQRLLETRWPVFVWGAPGVGKSSVVRSVTESLGLQLIDVRAPLLDPTDLRGIPVVSDGKAVWCPPSFLPHDPESKGVLFFDELNAAPPLVQASLYQLTLDRRIGEYVLPEGWRILAAGNRAGDGAIVFRLPSALANRFIHIDFEVDADDWRAWAVRAKVHPLIRAFLTLRRELLLDMKKPERAFPTPRSWEIASDALNRLGTIEDALDVLIGVVGEGAAMEFLGYSKTALTEKVVEAVIEAPETAELPSTLGDQYALVSYLVGRAAEAPVRKAAGVLLGRMPAELAVLLARDMLKAQPRFAADKGFLAFAAAHSELLR